MRPSGNPVGKSCPLPVLLMAMEMGEAVPGRMVAGTDKSMLSTLRKRSQARRACCVSAPRFSPCVQTAREYGLLGSADEKLKVDSSGYGETLPFCSTALPIRWGTQALPPT